MAADGTKLASGSRDGSVRVWAADSGELLRRVDVEVTGAAVEMGERSSVSAKLVGWCF